MRADNSHITAIRTLLIASLFVSAACKSPQIEPRYGKDACGFCRMTIVEPRFAAVAITEKGRRITFDAVECAVGYASQERRGSDSQSRLSVYVSIDHDGTMIPASSAYFVQADSVRSPMGRGIIAYELDHPGAISWSALLERARARPAIGGTQ